MVEGLLIAEADSRSALAKDIWSRICALANRECLCLDILELRRDAIPPCIGCLDCITVHPGRCIYDSVIGPVAQRAAGRTLLLFLTPTSFGNPSSTMKNILDRGGLIVKDAACTQIVIGCGEDATDEEASTFIDIFSKHRGAADIVHTGRKERIEACFTRSIEDNARIRNYLELLLNAEEK